MHAGGQEFESPNLHHFKQIEPLETEPFGSFLMLSIHSPFEEIIVDLNSDNPTSAISFLAYNVSGSLRKSITSLTFKSEAFTVLICVKIINRYD